MAKDLEKWTILQGKWQGPAVIFNPDLKCTAAIIQQIDHTQGNIIVAAEIPGVCSWTVGSIEMLVVVAIGN
jgi:hypothetical protein